MIASASPLTERATNPPHLSATAMRHLVADAIAAGVRPEVAWGELGLAEHRLPEGRVDAERAFALIERMLDCAGEDAYLEAWSRKGFTDLGPLGFAIAMSDDVRTATLRMCKYLPTFSTDLAFTMEDAGSDARLSLMPRCPPSRGRDARIAGVVGMIVSLGGRLADTSAIPWRVQLTGPPPASVSELRDAPFGREVRYNAPWAEIAGPAAALDRPLDQREPAMATFFAGQLEAELEVSGPAVGFEQQVREAVLATLSDDATVSGVAKRLGVSARTLQRRLGATGHTFHQLLADVRCELACLYLEADAPIGEISFSLGFSEPSAFHRAFKRWTGKTPQQWREVGGPEP